MNPIKISKKLGNVTVYSDTL